MTTNPDDSDAEYSKFLELAEEANRWLNEDSSQREEFYLHQNGTKLEDPVYDAYVACAKGTPFEGTIEKTEPYKFPDIVVKGRYGVEVKSTQSDTWSSIGSSILESSRIPGVEKIVLVFGKLHSPVEFKTRPYEECMSEIKVTHYPRYMIDMELVEGQTIFDKMGVPYDEICVQEDPVKPVRKYYKSILTECQSRWWGGDDIVDSSEQEAVSPIVTLWSKLEPKRAQNLFVEGLVRFPETLSRNLKTKYLNYAVWLIKTKSIVDPSMRDQFSAGGQCTIKVDGNVYEKQRRVLGKIVENKDNLLSFINVLYNDQAKGLGVKPLDCWLDKVKEYDREDYELIKKIMESKKVEVLNGRH